MPTEFPDFEEIQRYEDEQGNQAQGDRIHQEIVRRELADFYRRNLLAPEGSAAATPKPYTRSELVVHLQRAGITDGSIAVVHSSFRSVRPVEGGPQTVVDAFVEAVGPHGCVLFPTYDFRQWCHEHYWDRNHSPSKMGIITETARTDPRFRRSAHPVISYAVYGSEDHPWTMSYAQDGHGQGSLFDDMVRRNATLISIGALDESNPGFDVGNVGYTLIHHSETMAGAPYRFIKSFAGIYVDHGASAKVRSFKISVRAPGFRTAVSSAMEKMEEEGVISCSRFGHGRMHVGGAEAVHERVMKMARDTPILLRVPVKERR